MVKKGSQYSLRAVFPKRKQSKYLKRVKRELNFDNKKLSNALLVSRRTISAWENEETTMPKQALIELKQRYQIDVPKNIEYRKPFWSTRKAGEIGGERTYKKYGYVGGNQKKRKAAWRKWWQEKGKDKQEYDFIGKRIPINKPPFDKDLAEFAGIMLGDGGITEYQAIITLNQNEAQYINFIKRLIRKLFNIEPTIIHRKNQSVKNIVISSKNLVEFLTSKVGLKKGNKVKQNIAIPGWIFENKTFQKACLRGLIDTDGSFCEIKKYYFREKYSYPNLVFSNKAQGLLLSVHNIFNNLNLNPCKPTRSKVSLTSSKMTNKYMQLVNTNNTKHLSRYKNMMERCTELVR